MPHWRLSGYVDPWTTHPHFHAHHDGGGDVRRGNSPSSPRSFSHWTRGGRAGGRAVGKASGDVGRGGVYFVAGDCAAQALSAIKE